MNGAVKRKTMLPSKLTWQNRTAADKGQQNVNEGIAESVGLLLWLESTPYMVCARCAPINVVLTKRVRTCYRLGGYQSRDDSIKAESRLGRYRCGSVTTCAVFRFCRFVSKRIVSRLADHLSERIWLSKRLCSPHCRPFRLPFLMLHSRCGHQL